MLKSMVLSLFLTVLVNYTGNEIFFFCSFFFRLFKEYLQEAKRSAIFTQERSQEGEKRGFINA